MNRLKEIREIKGKTQKDVANHLGRTVTAYANYEAGRRDLDTETLLALADYFGVTTDYILGRTREDELKKKANEMTIDELLLKEAISIAEKIQSLPSFRRKEAKNYIEFLVEAYKDKEDWFNMGEDSLPDFIRKIMQSGITIEEQKLIRDALLEIYHLPLEEKEDYDKTFKWQRKHILW